MKRYFLLLAILATTIVTTSAQHSRKSTKTTTTAAGRKTGTTGQQSKAQQQAKVQNAQARAAQTQSRLQQRVSRKVQPTKETSAPTKGQTLQHGKGKQAVPVQKDKGIQTAPTQKGKARKGAAYTPHYVTTSQIKGLQQKNQLLQKEIVENETAVKEKQKDVNTRLQRIMQLDTEIGQQQKTIDNISADIHGLDNNIGILKGQLESLEQQLGERRRRFIRSMRYMARHRSIQDKMMFVFSAKSLTQMYRRLRFVREYAAYQRAQGELLKAKEEQIQLKHKQLAQVRNQKNVLLYKGRKAHAVMEGKRIAQQNIVTSLQQDQKNLEAVIAQRRQQQQAINAQIDHLVAIEIQKARERAIAEARAKAAARAAAAKKRAEELARKRAAAIKAAQENARRIAEAKAREAKAKAEAAARAAAAEKARREAGARAEAARAAAEKARQEAAAQASAARERARKRAEEQERKAEEAAARANAKAAAEQAKADQAAREAEANRMAAERKAEADSERAAKEAEAARHAAEEDNSWTKADRELSGSFANNRGRLPMPLSGRIINHFGQYNVPGMHNVRLSNDGINIKGAPGSAVRSVFMGEVSGIFSAGGSTIVMVRHGIYISVYCNMGSVSVHRGQKVGTGQTLGTVNSRGILQFQLRKETAKLNPEAWLR